MTVYIDDARKKFGRMVMCHMLADTPAELHTAARVLGLKFEWYQSPAKASFPHYDLSLTRRTVAIVNGAKQISRAECGAYMKMVKRKLIEANLTWQAAGW